MIKRQSKHKKDKKFRRRSRWKRRPLTSLTGKENRVNRKTLMRRRLMSKRRLCSISSGRSNLKKKLRKLNRQCSLPKKETWNSSDTTKWRNRLWSKKLPRKSSRTKKWLRKLSLKKMHSSNSSRKRKLSSGLKLSLLFLITNKERPMLKLRQSFSMNSLDRKNKSNRKLEMVNGERKKRPRSSL